MRSLHVPYHRVPKGLTRAHTQTYTHVSDGTLERYDACGLNTKHRNMHVHGERLGHEDLWVVRIDECFVGEIHLVHHRFAHLCGSV